MVFHEDNDQVFLFPGNVYQRDEPNSQQTICIHNWVQFSQGTRLEDITPGKTFHLFSKHVVLNISDDYQSCLCRSIYLAVQAFCVHFGLVYELGDSPIEYLPAGEAFKSV